MDARQLQAVGPYRIKRYIDEGAFAWVFEVVDPKFEGRRLALKMLKPEAAKGDEFGRFESEARLLAGIDHPNIVTIFDFGKDDATGCFFYTMTYVDGPTLKDRLREGTLELEQACEIFSDLLDGLAYLHDNDIVHRDIKPANVLLGRDGRARLSDLGIARVQTERSKTRTGMAVGTALYMSPEQARGRPVDPRSDLFSVGLTLYESLTGNVVYDHVEAVDSTSGMDVLIYIGGLDQRANAEFKIVFPSEPPLPKSIKNLIRRACALRASDRYQDGRTMRDDLKKVLQAPPEVQVAGISWKAVAALGGTALAVLAAVLYYYGVHLPAERRVVAQQRAQATFESTGALEARAIAILEAARALAPGPSTELQDEIGSKIDRAEDYLFDGAEDLDSEAFVPALANFERASQNYQTACELVGDGFLRGRAESERRRVDEALAALSSAGAAEVAADSWQPLQQQAAAISSLADAGRGCVGAQALLDSIAATAAAAAAADALADQVAETWPKLAEEQRQKALTVRMVADAEAVPDREYRIALREGKRLLLRGDLQVESGNFAEARDTFRGSEQFFEKARAIVPAAQARAEAQALAEKLAQEGAVLGGAVRLISRAENHFAGEEWPEAAGLYREALTLMKGKRAQQELERAGREARERAQQARAGAAAAGAERSSAEAFDRGDARLADAVTAFDTGDLAAAEEGFERARESFVEAREQAIPLMRDAELRQQGARAALAGLLAAAGSAPGTQAACSALASEAGVASCNSAERAIAAGSEALDALDGPTAQREFDRALAALTRAQDEEIAFERARPRPPLLEARRPEEAELRLVRDITHSFAVEVSDPNGDTLRYRWFLDGAALDESGPRLDQRIERSGVVEVRVDDGAGGELVERWSVTLENRPPSLDLQPASPKLGAAVGETLRFSASVADPDGDTVETRFLLDGAPVRDATPAGAGGIASYAFRASTPGRFAVEVVAVDAQGAETREAREVTVVASGGQRAPTLRTLPARAPEPETPSGLPSLPGWRGQVVQTLEAYQRALEERNLRDLERVFQLAEGSPVRAFYQRKFARGDAVKVSLQLIDEVRGDGSNAVVDFDQTEKTDARSRTYRYRASLVRSADGRWQIERRERRR